MADFPFTLGVEGTTFPLSGNPYWSRTNLFQIQGTIPKNYVLLGFKPGLPLQASELNEIQEIWAMENTLTITMISSWPVFLPSHSDDSMPLYGPGWNGTTPLYPQYNSPETTENLVEYDNGIIEVREGWYLVTIKTSGLKHWIYLNQGYTAEIPDATSPQYFGFTAYYTTIKPSQDPSLYDNSTGINLVTGAAAGADRIKVKLEAPFWTTNNSADNFSPMVKKINNDTDLLFMNNVTVPVVK